jgi:hypothetical protein
MIPATAKCLILNPAPLANEVTRENATRYAAVPAGGLEERLRELDHEWDVERLTAAASGLVLLGGVLLVWLLGAGWLVLPAILAVCLLLQGLAGWTPALPLIRLLGYRTPQEIAHERHALEIMHGDFQPKSLAAAPQNREDLSRFENEGGAPTGIPAPDAGTPAANQAAPATKC